MVIALPSYQGNDVPPRETQGISTRRWLRFIGIHGQISPEGARYKIKYANNGRLAYFTAPKDIQVSGIEEVFFIDSVKELLLDKRLQIRKSPRELAKYIEQLRDYKGYIDYFKIEAGNPARTPEEIRQVDELAAGAEEIEGLIEDIHQFRETADSLFTKLSSTANIPGERQALIAKLKQGLSYPEAHLSDVEQELSNLAYLESLKDDAAKFGVKLEYITGHKARFIYNDQEYSKFIFSEAELQNQRVTEITGFIPWKESDFSLFAGLMRAYQASHTISLAASPSPVILNAFAQIEPLTLNIEELELAEKLRIAREGKPRPIEIENSLKTVIEKRWQTCAYYTAA